MGAELKERVLDVHQLTGEGRQPGWKPTGGRKEGKTAGRQKKAAEAVLAEHAANGCRNIKTIGCRTQKTNNKRCAERSDGLHGRTTYTYFSADGASTFGRAVVMAAVAIPITELHSSREPLHTTIGI